MEKQGFGTKENKEVVDKKQTEKKSANCVTLKEVFVQGQKIGVGVEIFCDPSVLFEYIENGIVKEID
jgi:hypothetical protein